MMPRFGLFAGLCSLLVAVSLVISFFVLSGQHSLLYQGSYSKSVDSSGNTRAIHAPKEIPPVGGIGIEQISLLGERNSGTRWSYAHLTDCFGHAVPVKDSLIRHKHWFQHDIDIWKDAGQKRPRTLVVSQFRHPYYWVEAMRVRPHHSPEHYDVDNRKSVNWTSFVKTPWTTKERPEADLQMLAAHNDTETTLECQERFKYHQIVSCSSEPYDDDRSHRFCAHTPQYELKLDDSGEPYNSIVDLRADKIRNHLSVSTWSWVPHFVQIRYEDLLEYGTSLMITHIANVTGIEPNCTAFPAQTDRPTRPLKPKFMSWMDQHIDWEAEALIGYDRRSSAQE
jgi:hypothetical protein